MPTSDRGPRLIVVFADGHGRLAHPLPLPPQYATPCEFVAAVGALVPEGQREAAWWVEPGRARNPGNVGPTPSPTEAP